MSTHAAFLNFDLTAQNNSDDPGLNMIVPNGGIVTLSLVANVPDLEPRVVEDFPATSGGVTWDNGGPQTYDFLESAPGPFSGVNQTVGIGANGNDQIFGTVTLAGVFFVVNVGESPVTTTKGLATLLLGGTITDAAFLVRVDNGQSPVSFDVLSSSITPVPVPAAAWLFISALGGLVAAKRRKLKA